MVTGYNRVPVLLTALLLWLPGVLSAQEPELLAPLHSSIADGTAQVGVPSLLGEALRSVALTRYCPSMTNEEPSWLARARSATQEKCVSQRSGGSLRNNHAITYTPDWEGFRRDIVMQGAINLNVVGIIYIMPESVTNWTAEQKRAGLGNYRANFSKGPHLDHDHWAFNYITHPLTGSGYFVTARRRGFGWKGALLYSSLVSTFGWELGVETFFEQPSVQDLWVTPVFGTIIGESMLRLHQRLFERRVGSRVLGIILLGVIDPTGSLSRWLEGTGLSFSVTSDGLTLSW